MDTPTTTYVATAPEPTSSMYEDLQYNFLEKMYMTFLVPTVLAGLLSLLSLLFNFDVSDYIYVSSILSLVLLIVLYFCRLTTQTRVLVFALWFIVAVVAAPDDNDLHYALIAFPISCLIIGSLLFYQKKPLKQHSYFVLIVVSSVVTSIIINSVAKSLSLGGFTRQTFYVLVPLLILVLNMDHLYTSWLKYNDPVSAGIYLFVESIVFIIVILRHCCECCSPDKQVDVETQKLVTVESSKV
ncbi:hypothetical protein P9112_012556 [Eukaryota sp. TZLM1-RC]